MTRCISLPAGIVVPYAGALPINTHDDTEGAKQRELYLERHGWLPCDGRAVEISQYHELFCAIRFFYGKEQDRGEGWFRLPDYRGRFLRGVNGCAIGSDNLPRDPQVAQRQPASTDLHAWQVGSEQEDALQYHGHPYSHTKTTAQAKAEPGVSPLINPLLPATSGTPTALDASQDPPSTVQISELNETTCQPDATPLDTWPEVRLSPETRVKNIYVHFIISHGHSIADKG